MTEQTRISDKLRNVGLRPTRQRMVLAKILFEEEGRHVTAEGLYSEALDQGMQVSLATVYNTLHQFTERGLLREVTMDASRAYFDTNTSDHHHFFFENDGELTDIPPNAIDIRALPTPPEGTEVSSVNVVIRVKGASSEVSGKGVIR